MDVQIYTVVFCPVGEYPTKDNCKTVNVVSDDVNDAFKTAFASEENMRIVSISYTADAILSGTIVDFE